MASMYAKLMSRITESSLMEEAVEVRYCFLMMLAMADPQGYVIGTDVAIARRMNVSTADFKAWVEELKKPDPDSNSQEQDGRRVTPSDCERGYYVVNYRKYRDTRDEEQRREYMREYMVKRRAAEKQPGVDGKQGKHSKPPLAKAEVEVKAEAKEHTPAPPPPRPPTPTPPNGNTPQSEEAKMLSALFFRPETEPWKPAERQAFRSLWPFDIQILRMVCRYTQEERKKGEQGRDRGIHKRSLLALLENWHEQVDRARAWAAANPKTAAKANRATAAAPAEDPEPAGFREWFAAEYPRAQADHPWPEIPADIREKFKLEAR